MVLKVEVAVGSLRKGYGSLKQTLWKFKPPTSPEPKGRVPHLWERYGNFKSTNNRPRNAARRNAGVDRTCRSRLGRGMLHGGRPGPIVHADREQPEEWRAEAGWGKPHIPIMTRLRNAGRRQVGADRTCQSRPG
ncbi:hypothetical protein CALVIDRAFT_165236 [Calocera viscosa TUFC12733]|uniref:Uncharacterized protein n=1 Tax=Calocera viscosa (strain TUFC12733) TaxID=1330018 RepID=A0A167LFJ2_CALVF|nr:hypothetical protein CALVIDRAFT_165236 [Calocera viscosa TUFC12733]